MPKLIGWCEAIGKTRFRPTRIWTAWSPSHVINCDTLGNQATVRPLACCEARFARPTTTWCSMPKAFFEAGWRPIGPQRPAGLALPMLGKAEDGD